MIIKFNKNKSNNVDNFEFSDPNILMIVYEANDSKFPIDAIIYNLQGNWCASLAILMLVNRSEPLP